jgi:bifunctional UDP-N-acetylglucosamine pyrophosphorylase/glucosamine-1-phosphate N-acetyltransferase
MNTMIQTQPNHNHDLHIIILAAGQGKRMQSTQPKVLQKLSGKALLAHVIDTVRLLKPSKIITVVGHQKEEIYKSFSQDIDLSWAEQTEQKGTAHAVFTASTVSNDRARWLILYGDVPLIKKETLDHFLSKTPHDALGIITDILDHPQGYGRILRDKNQQVCKITEEKDASINEKAICEINTGMMVLPAKMFSDLWPRISNDNVQNEYYLTDLVHLAYQHQYPIHTMQVPNHEEAFGVNDRQQLASLERLYQKKQAEYLMQQQGVHIMDPMRIDIRGTLTCGKDVVIDIGCIFEGNVSLEDGVYVGPYSIIRSSHIGAHTQIEAYSHIDQTTSHSNVHIGPFARLRPGSILYSQSRVGNFVEIKNSSLGKQSKVNHLSYIGDARIEQHVNIGAGTITCNYDGINKHQTIIREKAFVGSGCMLVAPLEIGARATIGAGSVITKNAPEGQLTLSRVKQTHIADWTRPIKKQEP